MTTGPLQQQLSFRHNVPGTVYVLHFEPAYKHAGHYVGWTEGEVTERIAVHLQGRGSPLIRAAVAAGVDVQLARPMRGRGIWSGGSRAGITPSGSARSAATTGGRGGDRHDPAQRDGRVRSVPRAGHRRQPRRYGGARGRPVRDWLTKLMRARELTIADVARAIGRDEEMVRGWFRVRGRDWRTQAPDRFVVHVISELTIEAVGIALTANPRLVAELYAHMAEPVCQRCGAPADCAHLGRDLQLEQIDDLAA